MNGENARQIARNIGSCLELESDSEMQMRGFVRIKTEININSLLVPGFWWMNTRGEDNCATIKYERISDFCYGCGRLGHTSQGYQDEIVLSEVNPRLPMYSPWINGTRPRIQSGWQQIGGSNHPQRQSRDPSRKS